MPPAVFETSLPLPNRRSGKVRDLYDATLADGRNGLLMIATDRISAFDVVMPTAIAGKGIVLTQMSRYWFAMIEMHVGGLDHHVLTCNPASVVGLSDADRRLIDGRMMIGRPCRTIPIECVVRGYLAGSGWVEYQRSGSVCGVKLPAGLRQCDKLPEPIFTPATKAATGHDENISFDQACKSVDPALMHQLRDLSIRIYRMAHDHAAEKGIILADTKFEFGMPLDDPNGKPILIDEVLTPDSSRFWPGQDYAPGRDQASYDKQFVRNYLQELVDQGRWNKQDPGPELPAEVVSGTLDKYLQAYEALTDHPLDLSRYA